VDKFEQITKLAQAAMLIQEVLPWVTNPEFLPTLRVMTDNLADISDQIEES
jgi:hypothetical protein